MKRGRPHKYKELLLSLDKDVLFTPAMIADHAEKNGTIQEYMENDTIPLDLAKQRIRITMGRFSNNRKFPDAGDGIVTKKGQSPTPAWFGWRWIDAIEN